MADEKKNLPGETPATVTETVTPQGQAVETTVTETETEEFDEARSRDLISKLRVENRVLSKKAKRADELEQAEQKRKDAEMSETDKLRRQIAELTEKAAKSERAALVQKIAAETGLPAVLADRLQGEDAEALREDAAKLLEIVKTPQTQKQAKVETTLPTNGAKPESEQQKADRILRPYGNNPFSADEVKKMGGGVLFTND